MVEVSEKFNLHPNVCKATFFIKPIKREGGNNNLRLQSDLDFLFYYSSGFGTGTSSGTSNTGKSTFSIEPVSAFLTSSTVTLSSLNRVK